MTLELAEKVQALMNNLKDWKSLLHDIHRRGWPEDVVRQKVAKYNKRIDEIKKEIEEL